MTLVTPEPRDGGAYGENDSTPVEKMTLVVAICPYPLPLRVGLRIRDYSLTTRYHSKRLEKGLQRLALLYIVEIEISIGCRTYHGIR